MNNVGAKILLRRKELKLTQKQLGDQIGTSATAVGQWEKNDNKPSGENLYNLCKALSCQPDWLLYGEGERSGCNSPSLVPTPIGKRKFVPLVSWSDIDRWEDETDATKKKETFKYEPVTADFGPSAFAVQIRGDSMTNAALGCKSIPEGAVAIIDPDLTAGNEDIVLTKPKGSKTAIIKKLVIDGPNQYLKSLNPDYRLIAIDNDCLFLGVVKQINISIA